MTESVAWNTEQPNTVNYRLFIWIVSALWSWSYSNGWDKNLLSHTHRDQDIWTRGLVVAVASLFQLKPKQWVNSSRCQELVGDKRFDKLLMKESNLHISSWARYCGQGYTYCNLQQIFTDAPLRYLHMLIIAWDGSVLSITFLASFKFGTSVPASYGLNL